MEKIFTDIYESERWGNNKELNYKGSSGIGSKLHYNINTYVPFIKNFISKYKIKNVVDLGCGDFICGKYIYDDIDISYTGYDAYKRVIEVNSEKHSQLKYSFKYLDFFNFKEEIVSGELCILKDVLQHWTLNSVYSFLDYLVENKKFRYILICNCCDQKIDNTDIQTIGDFRPLSCDFLPLKKYNPKKLYKYNTKEISVIEIS
tara:strand:- start:765 stop:1373 length:609 start_codon:yes stop_codon:yes gene_type:complete